MFCKMCGKKVVRRRGRWWHLIGEQQLFDPMLSTEAKEVTPNEMPGKKKRKEEKPKQIVVVYSELVTGDQHHAR